MPPKLRNAVVCFSGTFEAPVATLQKWTEANGGTFERKLTPSTTHLVVSEVNWRAQVPEVQTALANGTKVIDYEWFDDKLRITGRVTENKYLWTTIDAERLKQEAKDARAAERVKKRAEKEKEKKKKDAERINYADAFMQHTNEVAHISDEGSGEEEEDGSSSEETSTAKQHSALAEQFAKGAKQAKEDLMSDNHHIYMDVTGFSYDIVVTKASVELSQLDRARITVSTSCFSRFSSSLTDLLLLSIALRIQCFASHLCCLCQDPSLHPCQQLRYHYRQRRQFSYCLQVPAREFQGLHWSGVGRARQEILGSFFIGSAT